MSSSTYSEEDIRRAAEIREWLIKQISDRQEEVERLRTTLSIIDNLLKQGSFKAAANLGFAASHPCRSRSHDGNNGNNTHSAGSRHQGEERAAAPTLKTTAGDDDDNNSDNNNRRDNIRPLKRAKDDFLLANAEVSPDAVVIVPSSGVSVNANIPPFKSFFLNRILEGMKSKDAEKVNQGALRESDALNYKVEEDDGGIIKCIVINNYRDKDRLQEIFNTSTWVITRMLEKSGS